MRIDGSVALVTGASRGIGCATQRRQLASAGAKVALTSRTATELETVAERSSAAEGTRSRRG